MKMTRSILSLFLLTLLAAPAMAQSRYATISTYLNQSALKAGGDAVVAVVVDIKAGYHAQSHAPLEDFYIKFQTTLDPADGITPGTIVYPAGKVEEYTGLGKLSVYTGQVIVYVPLKVADAARPAPLTVKGKVTFQICDDRTCFPPETHPFTLATEVVAADAAVTSAHPEIFAGYVPAATQPADASRAATQPAASTSWSNSQDWGIPFAFGAALLAGLLFNVMPCVLPVLPLKAVGFYEASQHNRSRSIMLGLVFSLGLISVFVLLALLVLVLKAVSWGDLFSYGAFIWTIVIILTILAAGLLGGWDLRLPLGVYTFEPRHDTFGGNYFWGALTAILATPCTAPLLPPLLLWAARNPAYIGVPAVVMVGVGMALPYLILSAMPEVARNLPRAGPWSELFKQMMGFLLLAAAAYFGAGRLISGSGFWWVVVAVVAIGAFFLMARTVQLTTNARPVGISSAIAVIMIGGTIWWASGFTNHDWQPYSDARFEALRRSGKPVLVKFTANWCGTCQYIERTVYQEPEVWQAMKDDDVTPLKVDLTNPDAPGKELLLTLNPSGGIPLTAIWVPGSNEPIQLASVYGTGELLKALQQVK
jgi:thiol:disulfide interchange protein DsbD